MLTLALDIGGTKIAVGLTNPAGELVHKAVSPTPKDKESEHVWGLVARMIADATNVAQGAIHAVGIGCAGPIDAVAGTVSPINIASILRTIGFVEAHEGGLNGWAWHPGDPDTDPTLTIRTVSGRILRRITATALDADVQLAVPLARPRSFVVSAEALRRAQ